MKIDPYIRQIIDRCHVSQSNKSIIKYLVSRMKEKHKGWLKNPKDKRKLAMKQAIHVHNQNKDLYRKVMA